MTPKWVALGSIASITSGGTPSRKVARYWGGSIPWIKTAQIQNCRIGDTDVDEWITPDAVADSSARMVPAGSILMAMYGQGRTRGQVAILDIDATVNQACAAIVLRESVDRDYVFQQLLFRYEAIRALSNAGSQENLNADLIRQIAFPLPALHVQRAIAQLADEWDKAIDKTERLIAAKRLWLSESGERLLNGSEAKRVRLREATRESVRRNGTALGRDQIMGITNDRGMRPMREETIAASIDRYKIVRPRAFAYNPMRLNVGSIAMSPFDRDVLVSPDYVVFECDESTLLPGYLNHLRRTRHWAGFFDAAGSGSVRVRIYYDDLAAITFPLPSIEEQRRVVAVLDTASTEIDVLTRYAEALRRQKRGLMQKLLTGQWHLPARAITLQEHAPC
jgi:type I restriction enzyme S subunit